MIGKKIIGSKMTTKRMKTLSLLNLKLYHLWPMTDSSVWHLSLFYMTFNKLKEEACPLVGIKIAYLNIVHKDQMSDIQ